MTRDEMIAEINEFRLDFGREPFVTLTDEELQFHTWVLDSYLTEDGETDPWTVEEELKRGFQCVDCATNTLDGDEYYMVHDHVWEGEAKMDKGMLCIGCLEVRIGRALTPADFIDAPVNYIPQRRSARLQDRLGMRRAA